MQGKAPMAVPHIRFINGYANSTWSEPGPEALGSCYLEGKEKLYSYSSRDVAKIVRRVVLME